ncbi:transcriptional pleiotropic regulator of transition state genes [Clostridium saccharoperbutylacetonicum]|uniref:SpoVT-AbrB domain-containing protein n=1 Tax=Clostridium saccharoperbutylacetonicum N1-4(HMT) TaxID=931276 RepID=M1MMI3_9CLOT|nr:AbrB/MazE/SpoVT family DNA-binding domain-containing protein [Clostridium saccharoperbutylacetonicum]AGF57433.1 hypothetical protein Cspa_c36730 [Clostridium saccharoperbutylacetonicum N1-4(HMT)]NRT61801.1 transcriptional pleiotropic regulator of transition state genes [Clostridium saccharoperbutylacetonicum]NSB25126.1 transcriptional pleiotropic regulator of transition state genes [Clostridium saccharoperbutylacetonicum]NSB44497.1 transcriptional pleiotropic regulator of transition state ge
MKESGMVRKVDALGRFVIPSEIRNVLGISEGDPLEIVKVNNEIVVKKYHRGCIFCGCEKGILAFKDLIVCEGCRKDFGQE